MPLNVNQLRPDFVVTVGYKWLLGPFGVGYLYVAEDRHGEPLEENWILRAGSEDFARLVEYRDERGGRNWPDRSRRRRHRPEPQVRNTVADANCFAAIRSGSLRIAPHLHTTEDDERTLLNALTKGVRPSRPRA